MKKLFLLCLALYTLTAHANDAIVKEDLTPPAAEGALTSDQIPPLLTLEQLQAKNTITKN
ncbi:hypothetical protein AYO45_06520 [Gammaproteobacteria bacterium SCGC AG-212-F23]|nr:hypothetical protein AYO45_06520 [Gammaproteobacteria bacterium SCGC AG-212-F23]